MPRFLIRTSLSEIELRMALGELGIEMDLYAPAREIGASRLVDAGLRFVEDEAKNIELRSRVSVVNGVEQILPVPNAKPG